MSGHHPFSQLLKNFSPEELAEIQQKKQALTHLELHHLIKNASLDWEIDPEATPLEQVELSLRYLRQIVTDMGGELEITAKFANNMEIPIDCLPVAIVTK